MEESQYLNLEINPAWEWDNVFSSDDDDVHEDVDCGVVEMNEESDDVVDAYDKVFSNVLPYCSDILSSLFLDMA